MDSARVRGVEARAFTVPTDAPESDGTLAWGETTMVLVTVRAGGATGLGYSYTHRCAVDLIHDTLAPVLLGRDSEDIAGAWTALIAAVRNLGSGGIAATAISALDVALWDLKARLLGLPLIGLLGASRERVPVYGSGGFTSYDDRRLADQLGGWARSGMRMVKMKVGREPGRDLARARAARAAIGEGVELFVDANGAYEPKQALELGERYRDLGVTWFEEPVPSQDVARLRFIRERMSAGIEVAGGEYEFTLDDAQRLLDGGAVDVLQADATRCAGISGFIATAALCAARAMPLSAHCAPALHVHLGCALPAVRHCEWFHDHARIEALLFDGAVAPERGEAAPDRSRPGLGLELKLADARRYAA